MRMVNAIHIFFVGPLLVLIGGLHPKSWYPYHLLLFMGAFVMAKFVKQMLSKRLTSESLWYVIHIIFFALLLLYVGYLGPNTPKAVMSILLALGLTAIIYHTIRAIGVKA